MTFMERLREAKWVIGFIIFIVGATLGFSSHFVTAEEFRTYKNKQEYKDAKRERRELRQEVSEYEVILSERGHLTPKESEDYGEAVEDLEDVRGTIQAYKAAKKKELEKK